MQKSLIAKDIPLNIYENVAIISYAHGITMALSIYEVVQYMSVVFLSDVGTLNKVFDGFFFLIPILACFLGVYAFHKKNALYHSFYLYTLSGWTLFFAGVAIYYCSELFDPVEKVKDNKIVEELSNASVVGAISLMGVVTVHICCCYFNYRASFIFEEYVALAFQPDFLRPPRGSIFQENNIEMNNTMNTTTFTESGVMNQITNNSEVYAIEKTNKTKSDSVSGKDTENKSRSNSGKSNQNKSRANSGKNGRSPAQSQNQKVVQDEEKQEPQQQQKVEESAQQEEE